MSASIKQFFDHFSPSHLNLYSESPAKWALCYLHKVRDESPAMWRGTAVEAGIVAYLRLRDLDEAIRSALERFELEAQGEVTPEIEKELAVIPGMVEQGSIALADRPFPDATQLKVEHWFDGIEIPILGYVDAIWAETGLEIKTTNAMPSELRESHARQAGFYSICKKRPFDVLYVTPKKHQIFRVEDPQQYVRRMEWAAHAIVGLLTAFPDRDAATRILPPPDYGHPYLWKSETSRAAAEQIWR